MPERDIVAEAVAGLHEYRFGLLAHFGSTVSIDPAPLRKTLAAEGLEATSPIVMVPYTYDSLCEAADMRHTTTWHEPSVAEVFDSALADVQRNALGDTTDFYFSSLDLIVILDTFAYHQEQHGVTRACGFAIDGYAHELTHAALRGAGSHTFAPLEDHKSVRIRSSYGLSGAVGSHDVWEGGGTITPWTNSWLDEAFANYMAARVRARLYPESSPRQSHILPQTVFGIDKLEVPPEHLIGSDFDEFFPDEASIAVASMGMTILAEKRRHVIPQIKAVAANRLSADIFRANLQNSVGAEVFRLITEDGPPEQWGVIYNALQEL